MISGDIWHKYGEWYFEIVIRNLRQFWNITSGIYAKYQVQIMILFVYTTTRKRFVIFTCRYFKLSWNTTTLSQSNWRHFSSSSLKNCNLPLFLLTYFTIWTCESFWTVAYRTKWGVYACPIAWTLRSRAIFRWPFV